MATQARVLSTDVFESLRTSLIIFSKKAHRSIDDASDEARRTRVWLQHDQRLHWEGELRRRTKTLDQAQQELRSAQITGNRDSALVIRQRNVARAQQNVEEAQGKLRQVKKWNQSFDHSADPLLKRLEGIRHFLDHELPKALAYLGNVQRTLDENAPPAAPPTTAVQPEIPTPPPA